MISVSLTSQPGPVRQLMERTLADIVRDPGGEPGHRPDRLFDAVQLDARRQFRAEEAGRTARRELRHRLSERGLSLSGLMFPLRGSLADPERLDERIHAVQQAMALAFDLGTRALVVPGGRVPEANSAESERLADVIETIARHGDRTGATLTLQIGSDGEAWNAWLSDVSQAAPVAVQFDPAACVMSGQAMERNLRALSDRVSQLRIRDGVSESRTSGREVTVGRGEVDFDLLAGMATELSARPTLVIDPDAARPAELRQAVQFVRTVFTPAA